MTRRSLLLLALPAALSLTVAGCLESEVELAVQRDGSGTVTESVWLTQAMMDLGGVGGGQDAEKPKGEFHPMIGRMTDKALLEKRAAAMGEGVTVKSVTPRKDAGGRQGYVVVYDVKDVNKIKLDMNPAGPPSRGPRAGQGKQEKEPIQVQYKPNANSLTILIPKPEASPEKTPKPPEKPVDDTQKQATDMMKQMFAGMKIAIRVKVPGTITKTNASLVNEKKDTVTLLEMDIGGLLQDEKLTKKLQEIGRIKDVAEARDKLNDPEMKKYIKIELEPKIEIEFK